MITPSDIAAAIGSIRHDPLLLGSLKAKLEKQAPEFLELCKPIRKLSSKDFPALGSIMAAQCSVFDNWIEHGGKRPKRGEEGHWSDRFKVEISAWHSTKSDIDWNQPAYRGTAHLWSQKDIQARAKGRATGLRLPKALDDEFRELVTHLGNSEEWAGMRFGLPYIRDGKTILYNTDRTLVLVEEGELVAHHIKSITVRVGTDDFVFDDFQSTSSKGNKLAGNCFAHSRKTTDASLADKWNGSLIQPASCNEAA